VATRVGIALGSNLPSPQGDRLSNIVAARDLLVELMPPYENIKQAPIFQSEPLDCPEGSPVFLNTVVEISYDGTADGLLKKTQAIERQLGRNSVHQRNAPRIIDIDILYFGSESHHQEDLIIPHPEIPHRLFVLKPLADIRPELVLPGNDKTIADQLQHLDSDEAPLSLVTTSW
jgi:2-amino-4-hydroxy-6-hydroxymethyldihydropteridine diphosphokinase